MNGMISKIVIIGIIAIIVLAVMKLFGVLPKHRDKKYETRIPDNQDMYRTNPMILNEKKLNKTNVLKITKITKIKNHKNCKNQKKIQKQLFIFSNTIYNEFRKR